MSDHFGPEGTWYSDQGEFSQKPKRTLSELRNLHVGYSVSMSHQKSEDGLEITEDPGGSEKGIKHEDSHGSGHRDSTNSNDSDSWSIASSEQVNFAGEAGKARQFFRKLRKKMSPSYGSDYEQVFPKMDAIKRPKRKSSVAFGENRVNQADQYIKDNIEQLSGRGLGGKYTKDAFLGRYELLHEQFDDSKGKLGKGKKREKYEKDAEFFIDINKLVKMENILKKYMEWKGFGKLFAKRLTGESDVALSGNDEIKIAQHRLKYASFEVGRIYKEKGHCDELNTALHKESLFSERYIQLSSEDIDKLKSEVKEIRNEWRKLGWDDPQSLSKEDKRKIRECEYRQVALEEGVSSALSDMLSDPSGDSLHLADLDYLHLENSKIKKSISRVLRAFESDGKDSVPNNLKLFSDWVSADFSADFKAAMDAIPPGSKPNILVRIYQERVKENIDRIYEYTKNLHPDIEANLRRLADQMDNSIKQRVTYAANECFKREFISSIRKAYGFSEADLPDLATLADLDEMVMDDLPSINRHFKVSDVSGRLGKPLAIARGKAKYMIIKQEEALYRYRGCDKDTTEEFEKNFKIIENKELESEGKDERKFEIETESKKGVRSRSPENKVSSFANTITIKADNTMEFEGRSNYNYTDFSQSEMGWFHHCRLALKKAERTFSDVTFTRYRDPFVRNPEARNTMELFVQHVESNIYGEKEDTFPEGSDGFYAYLGLEVGQGKGFIPAQHQIALKGRRLTSVKVKVPSSGLLSTECEFNA